LRELVESGALARLAGGGEHRMTHKHEWPTSVIADVVGWRGSTWPEGVSALEGSPVVPIGVFGPASSE
jgi:hypothetical protein